MGVKWWGVGAYERETKPGRGIKAKKLFRVCTNDLIINRIWVRHGSSGIIDETLDGCVVSQDFPTFEIDLSQVSTGWLRYMFRAKWFWEECEIKSRGTSGRQRINPEEYLDIEIPLPPLDKQRRIVAKLDALAIRIEKAISLQENALDETELLLSLALQHIFPDPQKSISEEWVVKQVEEISSKLQYGYTQSAQTEPVGPHFVRITDIQNGNVDWETVPYCFCDEKEFEKYKLHTGDILFARTGATTGKTYLVQDPPNAVFASYLIRLHIVNSILPEFVYWFFQSPHYWAQIKTRGVAQPNMNAVILSKLKVPIPKHDTKQSEIVSKVREIKSRIGALQIQQAATKAELDALLPSILDKAFRGEL